MSAASPALIDFAVCRVFNGDALVDELNLVTGDDARLTDARTPLAHTHVPGDVTGLDDHVTSLAEAVLDRILTSATGDVLVDSEGDVLWN